MLFNFKNKQVRTVLVKNEPYFVGKDVAEILGYSNVHEAVNEHVDKEDRKTLSYKASSKTRLANLWEGNDFSNKTLINESGLYALIFGSKLRSAKEFKRWVTAVVLPTIRKSGGYLTNNTIKNIHKDDDVVTRAKRDASNPTYMKQIFEKLEQEKNKINEMQPKVDYYEQILQAKDPIIVSQIAKDYGMGAQNFNLLLQKLNVQYKRRGQWLLYAPYQNKGYVDSKTFRTKAGFVAMQTVWTQKGREFLYKLLKKVDILPLIERNQTNLF